MSHVMNTYARLPITLEKGEGVWVWDKNGKRYLDALAGIAVNGLGHAHPKLVEAISEQAKKLIHVSNLYHIENQEILADMIADFSGMDHVFFSNSGAEANEAAIKLARLYGHNKGIYEAKIIVMEKSFHGRTMATLTATGNAKIQKGFEPLVSGFLRAEYGNLEALKTLARQYHDVVAVLLEPIQGEGGIHTAGEDYLRAVKEICEENEWLMMVDEVQTGIGRTGLWFAHQHANIIPDVMTLAKGLGSGVPIGACVVSGRAVDVFKPGNHGSTFGGNPLACQAGITTLTVLKEDNLLQHAIQMGQFIRIGLKELLKDNNEVIEIRGKGLMIGIELDRPCGELVSMCIEEGLLINVTADKVIRLLPPLIINENEARILINTLSQVVKKFLEKN